MTSPAISQSSTSASIDRHKLLSLFWFGFDTWLTRDRTSNEVFAGLARINESPLGRAQLNQLLHLSHEPGLSEGFYRYYWFTASPLHPYDVTKIAPFHPSWAKGDLIGSVDHLCWGLQRFYVDALLFFGDVRNAFNVLRVKTEAELKSFFSPHRFDTDALMRRGPALPLVKIAKDDRYLISEMACKSYVCSTGDDSDLKRFLFEAFREHKRSTGGKISIRKLFEVGSGKAVERQSEFLFSADDILAQEVENEEQLESQYRRVFAAFNTARAAALRNTEYFLSMVNDLDVYVATSMRYRSDFRKVADFCEHIFKDPKLSKLQLRYFDPTMSAAEGHEDKGLIECLMVKSAKVLVYCAGEKDSFGKDAEAAMALSLGKPVIFYCDEAQRGRFFSQIHPLSRLINFSTGVAVGAIVTSSEDQVVELLLRIFENKMDYELEQRKTGIRLLEKQTKSVVRLQTKNGLLRETFWNYYHGKV